MGFFARSANRQYEATALRVDAATDAAIAIVESRMRGSVGNVEVAVASSSGMGQMVVDAHRPMFGQQAPGSWRGDPGSFGTATISRSGVLIIINAQVCRGRDAEIDKTLLHELAHAVQFNRPGARDQIVRGLANNYGIDPMTEREGRAANRRVDADEREAARMERHHRLLAQSI